MKRKIIIKEVQWSGPRIPDFIFIHAILTLCFGFLQVTSFRHGCNFTHHSLLTSNFSICPINSIITMDQTLNDPIFSHLLKIFCTSKNKFGYGPDRIVNCPIILTLWKINLITLSSFLRYSKNLFVEAIWMDIFPWTSTSVFSCKIKRLGREL